jgi:hypothetical protein
MLRHDGQLPLLPRARSGGSFGYGDPPPHGDELGRCAGETMHCDLVAVIEFWRRDGPSMTWRRDHSHEVVFFDG